MAFSCSTCIRVVEVSSDDPRDQDQVKLFNVWSSHHILKTEQFLSLHLVMPPSHQPHFNLILYLNGSGGILGGFLSLSFFAVLLFFPVELEISLLLGRQSFGSPHGKLLIGIFRKLFN